MSKFTPFVFAALIALSCAPFIPGQQITVSKENKTIAITTSDDASALADTAVVTVGFHIYGKDQDGTYAEATRVSNAIMAALTSAGVDRKAIESASQNLSPLSPNGEDDKARYAQGIRFEFSQSWHVTAPADRAADVIHLAVLSGGNDSGGISWQLKDDNALQAEAAGKALAHAQEVAERMAAGLKARLGPLVYASNQTPPRGIYALLGGGGGMLNTESAMSAVAKPNLKPLAITPERITKSATVYAVFAIE